jgi:hypothetical protein
MRTVTENIAFARLRRRLAAQLRFYISKEIGTRPRRYAAWAAEELANEAFVDLDATAPAPPRRRGRPKGTKRWVLAVRGRSNQEIANAILSEIWQAWIWAKKHPLPTTLSVVQGISRALEVRTPHLRTPGDAGAWDIQTGRNLLRIAEKAAIVREVRTHVGKRDKVPLITFTADVEALLIKETAAIGSLARCRGQGLRAEPIAGVVEVQSATDQRIAPFTPWPGTSPWIAADRVRATRWRINSGMLQVAGEVLQKRVDLAVAEEGKRAALRQHGTDLAAYHYARATDVRNGHLAVRWDHRGRLNQVDSPITYTGGSDLQRALLEFDDARPVRTKAGRQALARHLINQYGSKDVPIGEEEPWLATHAQTIRDVAAGALYVPDASEPLRFVAACKAWCAAERGEAIRTPVSIDATTSVLQHMALLLRDPQLAQLCNLWPGPRRDLYSEIAAACGKTFSRKAVKRVVMPTFYGETVYRATEALWQEGIRKGHKAALRKIYRATAELAPGAFWLWASLRAVASQSTRAGEPVRWTTPSGWQCTTDRRIDERVRHEITLPGEKRPITYSEIVPGDALDIKRQANAITANLIQSLDAALLHMAVAALPESVGCIAVAHDCFAVQADDVPVLRQTLMRTLADMYRGQDHLAAWWAAWEGAAWSRGARTRAVTVPLPERGVWDDRFLQGEYAFS